MRLLMKYRDWKLRRHVKKYGSKNKGYFNYFNKEWFNKHQKTLLFLLNHLFLKYWFRWILGIHRDVSFKSKINLILPHAYWFDAKYINDGEDVEVKTDFRTHQKFSKRIYYAFRPLWWALHCLDWVIQQTLAPEFSFGFDTLTVYPDANPESATVDGYVVNNKYTTEVDWATIRGAADGTGVGDTNTTENALQITVDDLSAGLYRIMQRSFYFFNTSSLGGGAIISGANIELYVNSKANDVSSEDVHIAGSNSTSTTSLSTADYSKILRTSFAEIVYASITTGVYNTWTLDSNGITNINLTGISRFSLQLENDLNDTEPSWTPTGAARSNRMNATYADYTGTTRDPKLVVTYTLPSNLIPMNIQNIMTQIRM